MALALASFAGCAGFPDHGSLPTSSSLQQPAAIAGSVDGGSDWREEARELRTFADRHDVEAEVLLRHQWPPDARLIQQRRALARQLHVAAAQVEQGAEVSMAAAAGVAFPFDLRQVRGTRAIHGISLGRLDLANRGLN